MSYNTPYGMDLSVLNRDDDTTQQFQSNNNAWQSGNNLGDYGASESGGGMSLPNLYNQGSVGGNLSGQNIQSGYGNDNSWDGNANSSGDPWISGSGSGSSNSSSGSNGGTDFGSFFNNIGRSYTNGIGVGDQAGLAGALSGPAFLAALQQYRNSGQYNQLGQQAAQVSNPFGSQRGQYQQQLSQLYSDPTAALNNPSHQAVVTKQLNSIQSRNRASGYMGSGKDNTDMADYQGQADAQYLDQEKQRLAELSGAQFNPASAGQFLMQGGQQAINSQNMALGTMMSPYLAYLQSQYAGNRTQNNGQTPGGGNTVRQAPGGVGGSPGGTNPPGTPSYPTTGNQSSGGTSYNDNGDLVDQNGQIVATRGPDGEYYVPSYPTSGVPSTGYGDSYTDPESVYGAGSGWNQDVGFEPDPSYWDSFEFPW